MHATAATRLALSLLLAHAAACSLIVDPKLVGGGDDGGTGDARRDAADPDAPGSLGGYLFDTTFRTEAGALPLFSHQQSETADVILIFVMAGSGDGLITESLGAPGVTMNSSPVMLLQRQYLAAPNLVTDLYAEPNVPSGNLVIALSGGAYPSGADSSYVVVVLGVRHTAGPLSVATTHSTAGSGTDIAFDLGVLGPEAIFVSGLTVENSSSQLSVAPGTTVMATTTSGTEPGVAGLVAIRESLSLDASNNAARAWTLAGLVIGHL